MTTSKFHVDNILSYLMNIVLQSDEWGQSAYCFWTWMMAFFYSSHGVMLPIFIRKVFGQECFVENVGFLWLSYPAGSVLITILVKALFATIHFKGFSVSIALCHFISIYTAYSMKSAHQEYLLMHVDDVNDNREASDESNQDLSETAPITEGLSESNILDSEQSTNYYHSLITILHL